MDISATNGSGQRVLPKPTHAFDRIQRGCRTVRFHSSDTMPGALIDRIAYGRSATGQTNRRIATEPIRQRSQRPFPKSRDSTAVSFAPISAMDVHCPHDRSAILIRSAERDSDGFLKLESLDFFETPSPKQSLRKTATAKADVEIR
jgi:hypothetical protein